MLSRQGTPAELVRLWLDGAFEVVASPLLLAELQRVLASPKIRSRMSEPEAEAFLRLLGDLANVVDDPVRPAAPRTADPDDEYLVALAEEVRAVIVSGDEHLLALAGRFPVHSPAEFRSLVRAQDDG